MMCLMERKVVTNEKKVICFNRNTNVNFKFDINRCNKR